MLVLAHPSNFKSMVWHHASIGGDVGRPLQTVLKYLADGWLMDGPRIVCRMNADNGHRWSQYQRMKKLMPREVE